MHIDHSKYIKINNSCLKKYCLSGVIVLAILMISSAQAFSQVIQAGMKAGAQMNWVKIDDPGARDSIMTSPTPGYSVGAVVSFKVRDRYFLYTEYLYTRKGKNITGKVDPHLKDRVTYNYFEIPVLFTMHFKANLGNSKEFKWYVGAGPEVSYLVSGKGVVEGGDLYDNDMVLDYKISFHPRENRDHPDEIHYNNANRFQFGLNVGGGILLEPGGKHKVMIDLRYAFDQSRIGRSKADFLVPTDYNDELRARFRSVKFSVIYLLESNTSKEVRNKGKSTRSKDR
jgi:opacity protein-like surface antigen